MNYYIVAKPTVISYFKNSNHFKINLGRAFTSSNSGARTITLDGFPKIYYDRTNYLIQSEGTVGVINFFSNPYMVDDVISVYDENFNDLHLVYDVKYMKSVSYNAYLGEVMCEFKNKYYPKEVDVKKVDDIKQVDIGTPDKLITEPWNATWKDVEAYLKTKRNRKI